MIKLSYKVICDLCGKECTEQNYDCTNYLNGVFPKPTNQYTYQIGYAAEMCDDCAAQIIKARDKAVAEWKAKQNGS